MSTPALRLRSLMFCPGNRSDMIAKLPRSEPDAVVIDLEDAVPADAKVEARQVARAGAADLIADGRIPAVFVRVNSSGSPWAEEDIALAVPPGTAGVVLPKLESAEQLDWVATRLDRAGLTDAVIIGGWETAAGVENAPRVGHRRLVAAYFGAEDYIADVGGERTAEGEEVAYARARAVMAARIIGVAAIDQVVVEVKNSERYRAEAVSARRLGYSGKMCLHPSQVAVAHEVFTPGTEEVDRCRRLLAAVAEAEREGRGVVLFEGGMVDVPVITQARRVLARAGTGEEQEEMEAEG